MSIFYKTCKGVEGISLREKPQWMSLLVSIPEGFLTHLAASGWFYFQPGIEHLALNKEGCHRTPELCRTFTQVL